MLSHPATGSHCNFIENTYISNKPNQKLGRDIPSSATSITPISEKEYGLTAEIIPAINPRTTVMTILKNASSMVIGKRIIISSNTG